MEQVSKALVEAEEAVEADATRRFLALVLPLEQISEALEEADATR